MTEFKNILCGYKINSYSLSGITSEIPKEDGSTFIENALIKARFAASKIKYKTPVIADDSGLCIEKLNNEPGIYSARWASEKNYTVAFNKIIDKFNKKRIKASGQQATFICVIVLINNYKKEFIYKGTLKGTLIFPPKGVLGFGYDPVFMPLGYQKTLAEIDPKLKNSISHRNNAIKKLLENKMFSAP